MHDIIVKTNAFLTLQKARAVHAHHRPSPLGYRTALLLPDWDAVPTKTQRNADKQFPGITRQCLPILSVAVSSKFLKSVLRQRRTLSTSIAFTTEGQYADMYCRTIEVDDEAITLVFDARDPLTSKVLGQWAATGVMLAILTDDTGRTLISLLERNFDVPTDLALLHSEKNPVEASKSRVRALVSALEDFDIKAERPANATVTYVAAPSDLLKVVAVIGDASSEGDFILHSIEK